MIFAHTLPQVLSGEKTQTARIWKDHYRFGVYDGKAAVISQPSGSYLYYVGDIRLVQPGRGQKGVARIRILRLWKQDVRTYVDFDAHCEGFGGLYTFLHAWTMMHDKPASPVLDNQSVGDWYTYMQQRPAERYTALCIGFELVSVAAHAVE